ncbi:MAG: hypothetical protein ACRDZ3_10185, partial [Acidimicrobiia bacterium]
RTAEPERLSVFAPSTGTISEGNGVRWRDAGDRPEDRRFGNNVVEMRFDRPQRVVGIYVGQSGAGDHGAAHLRTGPGDAPGPGTDTVSVSGGSALVTCMLVFHPDGSAFDTVTLVGHNYNRPEFDRLFFSETPFTPPARAGGASEAEITIFRPTPGQSFDAAAAFTVTGGVFLNAPRGGFAAAATPLDEVRVTWVDWDGMSFVTREVELSRPSPRGIVDGRAAGIGWTFRLDGVKVPPGESRIHAVAVGDRFLAADDVTVTGNGAPDAPPEGYAGKVDFQPLGVEVTQGLRPALRTVDPGGAFTEETVHVARRQTVVRLYGRTEFSGTRGEVRRRALPAEARLWGFSRRGALPGSPISPRNPVIDVTPVRRSGLALAGQRLEASRSWNFVLPPGWTGAGEITLVAEINPPSSPTHIPETKRTGGARNLTTVRRVRFAEIAPRPVNVILAESHQSDGRRTQRFVPTLAELAGVFDYWYRTWPIPVDGLEIESVDVYRQSFQACTAEDPAGTVCDPAPPASAPVWDNGVLAARYPDGMTDDGRRFIPLLFSPGSLVGCSGVAGVGGPPLFHAGACGPTVAQEAGHSMGLIHVSDAHGESTGGAFADRFSGDHGQLEGGAVGWDVRTMQPVPFEDGEEHRHDFMSYGGGSLPWVSTATWNSLAQKLRESDRDTGLFSGGAQPELVASTKAADDAPGVLVSGRLYGKGKGAIDSLVPAAEGASALPEPPPLSRQARLELRDAGGEVLMERGLEVAPDNHQGGNWPFRAMFPAVPEATAVVLVVGDEEVDSKKSEAPVPVISQVRARHEGDVLKLEFHAGAVDRDPLEVWLQARVGEVWRTVAGPFTGTTTADLPASELGAATGAGLLRMVATDGLHPVPSDVLLADLPPAPLQVAVAGVPAGGRVATHRALTFRALVSGAGGDAPALAWTLDGEPAAGDTEVTLAGVTPGPHVLKLVATTADGRTAEAESRIDVQPDRDGDGLTDGFEGTGDLDPDDPTDADRDGDGDLLAAWEEQAAGSDPGQADTDGDGYSDAVEVAAGSNPSHRASVPVRLHGDPTAEIPRVGAAAGGSGPNGLAALAGITALAAVGGCLALMRRRTNGNPRAGTA